MASKPRRRSEAQRKATAYHEAGHVVAQHFNRFPVKRASIVGDANTHGHVVSRAVNWETADEMRCQRKALCALAGEAAQRKACPGTRLGASSDRANANHYLIAASGSEREVRVRRQLVRIKLEGFIKKRWHAIEAVANALLERNELDAKEIKDTIIRAAFRPLPASVVKDLISIPGSSEIVDK